MKIPGRSSDSSLVARNCCRNPPWILDGTRTSSASHIRMLKKRTGGLFECSCNDPTPNRTQVDCNNILEKLRGLSSVSHLEEAVSIIFNLNTGVQSNIYANLFHACVHHNCLQLGMSLHQHMVAYDHISVRDLFVTNHLINMYSKFGCLENARYLFDEMPSRNLVSWTALISGYAQHGQADECFRVFSNMLGQYCPNEYAFVSVLSSCRESDGVRGRQVHGAAVKNSLDACVYVGNALITMYSKCSVCDLACGDGREDALLVFNTMKFRNHISWNAMIAGFQLRGLGAQAVNLFSQMHREGIGFDRASLLSVFSSLNGRNDNSVDLGLNHCFQLHCLCYKFGFISIVEVATALIKAYSDLGGDVSDCYKLFLETSGCQDVVSWTGIMTAVTDRNPEETLFLYRELRRVNLAPDRYTYSIVLKACARIANESHPMAVHCQVFKDGFDDDIVLANALILAYGRSGSISFPKKVFDEMLLRDTVSWNSVLKIYAQHGKAKDALQLFTKMDLPPDSTTFVALLSACSHAGMVEEGTKIFQTMFENNGIAPQLDHFACMVDILGRAGRVLEARELIRKMPMEPDSVIWSALLGACRKHGETHLAKLAAGKLKELEPENSLGYVQMFNIYCSGAKFIEAGLIRKEMKGSRVMKEPGLSWIEIGNQVHEFASGGKKHPQRDAICTKLEGIIVQLKEMGYVPETSLTLHDIEEEQKEEQLYYHSEKLALVFAIMNEGNLRSGGNVIKIMKNIRICVDCHNFMKLASDLLQKEIIVRDSNRFHHFKQSICSCNDYW